MIDYQIFITIWLILIPGALIISMAGFQRDNNAISYFVLWWLGGAALSFFAPSYQVGDLAYREVAWTLLGITLLIAVISPLGERMKDRGKKCPYCAEVIKREAKVCRYCKKELTDVTSE